MSSERDIKKLTDLQRRLRDLPDRDLGVTEEVTRLHGDICFTVIKIFGQESDEFSNIQSISLELPPELMDAGESVIRSTYRGSGRVGETEASLNMARRRYIRKRLDELNEVISTCIYTLQRRNR